MKLVRMRNLRADTAWLEPTSFWLSGIWAGSGAGEGEGVGAERAQGACEGQPTMAHVSRAVGDLRGGRGNVGEAGRQQELSGRRRAWQTAGATRDLLCQGQ